MTKKEDEPKVIGKFEWPKTRENMILGICPIDIDAVKPEEWLFGDADILHSQGYLDDAAQVQEIIIDRLIKWKKEHTENNFKIFHTYQQIIIVANNLREWNKKSHQELCQEFKLTLFEHNRIETYRHNTYTAKFNYTYIPQVENTKANNELKLKWREIQW